MRRSIALACLALLPVMELNYAHAAGPITGCGTSERVAIETIHSDLDRKLEELNDPARGIGQFTYSRIRESILIPEGRVPSQRYTQHVALYQNFYNKTVAVLRRMKEKVDSGYAYSCASRWDAVCNGGAYGYVKFLFGKPTNRITFCPSFWELDHDDQVQTTFHELSHLAALTTDDLGNLFTNEGMISQADEAYFYEGMIGQDLGQFLKIRSWGLIWLKPSSKVEPKPETKPAPGPARKPKPSPKPRPKLH